MLSLKILQSIRCWTKTFTTFQIVQEKEKSEFEKIWNSKKHVLSYVFQWKWHSLETSCFLEGHDFGLGKVKCIRFWTVFTTTCQILKWKIENVSEFQKNFAFKNLVMNHGAPQKQRFFTLPVFFEKHDFE